MFASYEGFRERHPDLVPSINGLSRDITEYNQLVESGADIAQRAHVLRCILFELQNLMHFIAPAGLNFTFNDLFPIDLFPIHPTPTDPSPTD